MKVKELIAKYPGYEVIEMGYPESFPFSDLPKELQGLTGKAYEKVSMKLEVKGYKVIDKPFTSISIGHVLFGGKKQPNVEYKGTLEIYLKGTSKYGTKKI